MQLVNGKIITARSGVTSTATSLTDSNIRGIEMAEKSLPKGPQKRECSVEGCETQCYAKNLCTKHYYKKLTTGSLEYVGTLNGDHPKYKAQFWTKINVTASPDECWEWMEKLDSRGYGSANPTIYGRKCYGAHRAAYIYHHSQDPGDLFVCHKCDNPKCCNPNHLYLGTHEDNAKDTADRARHHNGESHFRTFLSEREVKEIRVLHSFGVRTKALTQMYGCQKKVVQNIVNYFTWRHIP